MIYCSLWGKSESEIRFACCPPIVTASFSLICPWAEVSIVGCAARLIPPHSLPSRPNKSKCREGRVHGKYVQPTIIYSAGEDSGRLVRIRF